MGGKAATPIGILVPSFFFLEVIIMLYGFQRLIAAGVPENAAWETAFWFEHYGNDNDFDRYICEVENGQRERITDS